MDTSAAKKRWTKENPILKTWKKIKSLGHRTKNKDAPSSPLAVFTKSKSWHFPAPPSPQQDNNISDKDENNGEKQKKKKTQTVVAPEGCFTVCVGPKKQRFVVRTELVNHPLFKILLEDAETEFGYRSEGPIVLPCEVDFFFKVLAEIESCDGDDDWTNPPVCGLCSPYRPYGGATDSRVVKRYSSYKLLRTPPVFKLNRF